ncbi:MAG: enoyl-CoA hydratase/isomerase family protein [Chloroflexi bacterium]|nr:enoyl-CoA hydratase/isomerase family protein [Chloroflexota bacterium]
MAGKQFENVLYEKRGRIAIVTVNRPERMNAIDPQTSAELHEAWSDVRDDDNVWVGIFTGAGERAFSAGNDLVAMSQMQQQGLNAVSAAYSRAPFGGITRNFECWKPMIAAINGFCLAGGLEMALACDIRIAAEHATFGLPEVTRAIIPGAGGTQRLPRLIGLGPALELILTGGRFDAAWALRTGLVNDVVPAADVMPRAIAMAEAICENGPLAVRLAKEAAVRGLTMPIDEGLHLENEQSRKVLASEDAREGPLAFAQKRKPAYKGR